MMLTVLAIACTPAPTPVDPEAPVCEPEIITAGCLVWRCYEPTSGGIDLWYEGSSGRYGCEDYLCADGHSAAALAECDVVDDPGAACYPLPGVCGEVACSVCYEPGELGFAAWYECSDGWDRGVASFADQHEAIGDLLCHCDPAACSTHTGDTGL